MENSVNALKLAVSIFVFIIALTMVFALVTKIKDVADRVFVYSDNTNYYTYTEGTKDGTNGRIVGKHMFFGSISLAICEKYCVGNTSTLTKSNTNKLNILVFIF